MRRLAAEVGSNTVLMADLCPGPVHADHGHCGVLLADWSVDDDATLERIASIAVAQASAGAQVVAPSGMIDGRVGTIRSALDGAGFTDIPVLAFSAKLGVPASAGPVPGRGQVCAAVAATRSAYQQDPARSVAEALREVALDVAEGADAVMVKPALAYLDVVAAVRAAVDLPVAAYQVSGEYAMVEAAAAKGWIDRDRIITETLTAIRRAGADMILTYWAAEVAARLR